ncbi:Pyruvate kinase (PK) [Mycoplasmopsis bovigenitalium 51080]|uniref:Pyruvate kinase n=1 Tax=Mycoplasmopsis bovigenitalium 51080 TaxID=1188235 RepID=N9V473_9BACT|nr:pyruvate kinase [Mycoplasmopsis bovigenitalium]ENY70137.1 Pyruvate kinase (PK) [Mycoplasmopsis bovigenitalium 51080]
MKLDNHKQKLTITSGPASSDLETMKQIIAAGATVIRANFSHGSIEEQKHKFDTAKQAAKELGVNISLMLDTKGPEIRVGKMRDGAVALKSGQELKILTTTDEYLNVIGDEEHVTVGYDMSQDLKVGDTVLFDDGKLTSKVISVKPGIVTVELINSHTLKTNKRINLPNVDFSLPFLSEKDINDVIFGAEYGVDYVAASFVNNAKNVKDLRDLLNKHGGHEIQIISKIESQIGINNIDEIIEAGEGIMVARGDLGLEIPYYEVPYWQTQIIDKCRAANKVCVVATQMLDSLENNPQPTRAEVSDVYWATNYGADSTMLSNETAAGKYPVRAVEVMKTINKKAENDFYNSCKYTKYVEKLLAKLDLDNEQDIRVSKIVKSAMNGEYKYTIVVSKDESILRKLSNFRLNTTFIGVISNERAATTFGLNSGVKIINDTAKIYQNIIHDNNKVLDIEPMLEHDVDDSYLLVVEDKITFKKFTK